MKKILITYVMLVIFMLLPFNCCAGREVSIKINGNAVVTDVTPMIENDRVLVAVRSIFEHLGSKVLWDDTSKTVTITKENDTVMLMIDQSVAVVNGQLVALDVPARIVDGRTMVPVRFISENFDMNVQWDSATYTVDISSFQNKEPEVGKLKGVLVTGDDSVVKIKISGVGNIEHSMMKLSNPNRYVFDYKNCKLESYAYTALSCNSDYIKSVRWSQYDDDTCRVVIDLDKYYLYDYEIIGDDAYIIFDELPLNTNPPVSNIKPPVSNTGKTLVELANDYTASDFTPLDPDASGKLLIVDPGHGGSEVGTVGVYNGKEIYEKDVNIDICTALKIMLEKCGVSFYMLRDDDKYIGINERPQIANDKNGYFYLCVHNNASENKEFKGVQVYYSDETAAFGNMTNKQVSQIYYDNIASLGLKKSGVVDNPRYIVIYKSNMPAIIVENAFMSNKDDLELLMSDEFKVKLAAALCESTIQVLNKTAN